MARRISASVAWLTGTSGKRVSARTRPSRLSAYFAPLTPGSAKIAACSGVRRSWIFSAWRPVALERRLHQFRAEAGRDIRGHRNAAVPAGGHRRERRHVFARKLDKVRAHRVPLARHAADVAGRVLDADDVGQFGKPLHRVDRHVDDASRGNVVDDDRNSDRVVDGLEVLVEAFLRRLVVIGRDDQNGVRAALLGVAASSIASRGVVGARAGDHRNPAARFVDADVDGAAVLFMA